MILGLLGLSTLPAALAQAPPSDLSMSTVGAHFIDSASVDVVNGAPGGDVRFFFGERLRWTLGRREGASVRTRLLADARFTVDPAAGFLGDGQNFETNNVRQLGVEITGERFTVDVGRHPVFRGGPRLVDGLQALYRPTPELDVGFWGGLAPDFFETDFRLRPGFGPVIAYTGSRVQASVVGDVAFAEGGLDRAAVLALGRIASNRRIELFGRLDLELVSPDGPPQLSDLQLATILSPTASLRFDVFYNAFSAYRYIQTAAFDPEAQRFAQRIADLGRELGFLEIQQDPTVNHLVGVTGRFRGTGSGVRPLAELMARYRHNADPADRFARLRPTVGVLDLLGRVDLLASFNLYEVDDAVQWDLGGTAVVRLTDTLTLDGSLRALDAPDYAALGVYTDLYVDWVWEGPEIVIVGGVSYLSEPAAETPDGGPGVFVRVAKYVRPKRRVRAVSE